MKKLIISTLLMCFCVLSFSQERINKTKPKIGPIISHLTEAKGWILNPESQWISRKNRIPVNLPNENKILIDYADYGLGIDNFITYQFRDIKIGDSSFVILIKKYKNGYYRYESIREGWVNHNSVEYFIFRTTEMKKFKTLSRDSINLIEIPLLSYGGVDYINNETFVSDIQSEIVKESSFEESNSDVLNFFIRPYKNVIQFQIFSTHNLGYSIFGGVVNNQTYRDEMDKLVVPTYNNTYYTKAQELFKNFYYETDYLTFNNFINFKKQ